MAGEQRSLFEMFPPPEGFALWILAGNHYEYTRFVRRWGIEHRTYDIGSGVYGVHNICLVKTGSWRLRLDLHEILTELNVNVGVEQEWEIE